MAFQNLEVVHVVAMDQQRCIGKGMTYRGIFQPI